MIGPKEISNRFGYHRANTESAKTHNHIRREFEIFANVLDEVLPDGRDKSLAFTALQESMHWSNSAVAMENDVDTENPHLPNDPKLYTPKISRADH